MLYFRSPCSIIIYDPLPSFLLLHSCLSDNLMELNYFIFKVVKFSLNDNLSVCLSLSLRARRSTPATPAVTLCPVTPPAATVTNAGLTPWVLAPPVPSVTLVIPVTPTPWGKEALATVASMPLLCTRLPPAANQAN